MEGKKTPGSREGVPLDLSIRPRKGKKLGGGTSSVQPNVPGLGSDRHNCSSRYGRKVRKGRKERGTRTIHLLDSPDDRNNKHRRIAGRQ